MLAWPVGLPHHSLRPSPPISLSASGRALELGGGKKKRAPWDLKGQVSDLQAELKIYKEEVQQLRKGGQELEEQRQELLARNGDLDRQLQ